MSTNFEKCLKNGKKTEILIGEFLENKGYTVTDVSDDEYYRKIDVDLLMTDKDGDDFKLEIKSDKVMHRTGNAFFEDKMYRKTGTRDGWIHYCKADILCFYNEVNHTAYMLDWKSIKPILHKFTSRTFWNWRDGCYGRGYLVSLSYILDNDLCFKTYELDEFIRIKEVA